MKKVFTLILAAVLLLLSLTGCNFSISGNNNGTTPAPNDETTIKGIWYMVSDASPDFPTYIMLTFYDKGKCTTQHGTLTGNYEIEGDRLIVTFQEHIYLEGIVKTTDGVTVIEPVTKLGALCSNRDMNVAPTKTITEAAFIEEINKESFALFTVSNVAISEPELTNCVYICTVKYTTSISYQEGSTKDKTRDFVWIPALEKWCIPLESTIKQ